MLPSTGLFKSIICPLFADGDCKRPYCHFKHAKKDEEIDLSKSANYKPTPVSLTPTLLTIESSESTKKKVKLEYIPTKPGINDVHKVLKYNLESCNIPVYIPSTSTKEYNATEDDNEPKFSFNEQIESKELNCKKIKIGNLNETEEEKLESKKGKINSKEEKSGRREISRHHSSSGGTSHREEHRKFSSRSRQKLVIEKSSNKVRKELDKTKKHKERSSSKCSNHKKSSKMSLSKSSSSHLKGAVCKHTGSSSSKSHRTRSASREKIILTNSKNEEEIELNLPSPSSIFETSDEDDIMEQCKMIFEEYNAEKKCDVVHSPKTVQMCNNNEDDKYEDFHKKKRLAHDNGLNLDPPVNIPIRKTNHVRNAMQAIYRRQEIVRRQQEEAEEVAATQEVALASEKTHKMENKTLNQTTKTLTPLIPKSYLTLPSRSAVRPIAPVSNIVALERAKKKVEMLRAEKRITACQTASKIAPRIAHKDPVSNNIKPAPPILEATSTKISYNIRMQYYNMMVKHCLNIYPACEDAWERAQTEELAVFKKCNTPVIYKSSALLSINKLRKESISSGNVNIEKNKIVSHEVILAGKLAQNSSWSVNKKKKADATLFSGDSFLKPTGQKVYELIFELRLTEDQLQSNGFPRAGKKSGTAIILSNKQPRPPSDTERYCGRCSKLFSLAMYDEEAIDECNYHPKSTGYRRGFADNLHRCCQQPAGTLGCTYGNYHVTDYIDYDNLSGFVTTIDPESDYVPTQKDIFALDCEMCYTTHGVELTRLTVVDINSKTVYDTLVKPDNKVIDYNTVYSGITPDMLETVTRNLRDVQAILLSMFDSKTILIGHSLESDLKVLKLIHNVVVDTSVLYPHKMGPPKKRALKTLCIENLKRIIQENEKGHDSAEDAEVCIALVKHYLQNRIV